MKRALVLGGGGPVGIGWEAGLLVGMAGAGIDLGPADKVVGTSAASVVGFTLASGGDLTEAISLIAAASPTQSAGLAEESGLEALMASVAEAAAKPDEAERIRAQLGKFALTTETIPEETWLEMFAFSEGAEWPDRFACTAVDTANGRFRIWDQQSGVDVQHAIASSCAVPGIFPPVTIDGRRYMDGGVRDMVNADAAAGCDTVLAVSCTLLELPAGLSTPELDTMFGATRAQLDGLRRAGAQVETVVPGQEMLEISGWGLNLMDFSAAAGAYEAGIRQGAQEAERLTGFWAA